MARTPKPDNYLPPPRPGAGETGPSIASSPARIASKLVYRQLASEIERSTERSADKAAEAAARKVR